MRRFLSVTATAQLLMLLFSVNGASAQGDVPAARVCNTTLRSTLTIAIGYVTDVDYTTEGWWNVEPRGCSNIGVNWTIEGAKYYYAFDQDGNRWYGNKYLCTSDYAFTIDDADRTNECSTFHGFRRFNSYQLNF